MTDSFSSDLPPASDAPLRAGVEVIREYLSQMPLSPGVYRMLNAKGDVLYVGKAKLLKNRVTSYTNLAALSTRIARMVAQTANMEITVTSSEAEALLLEANLIKKFQPRYNILLRDDKSFPYIVLTRDHPYSQIRKHRGAQTQKGDYYGPFASTGAVNDTIAILQRAFLLRPCSDNVFKNRTRPCLQYQIKRCSAPCVSHISTEDYAKLVYQAELFLSGKSREVQESLAEEMKRLSDNMQYEAAAELRDRIRALTRVQQEQRIHAPGMPYADVIALHREGNTSCIQVVFFRAGQNYGNQAYFPSHTEGADDAEILSAFLGQFYQTHEPPKHIIVSHTLQDEEVLRDALSLRTNYKVQIILPQKGEKMEALQYALHNAKESLLLRLSEHSTQRKLLEGVAATFGLDNPPRRIEVYDNSHIMGTNAVGAMIVAGPEGFNKKAYRKFNIRDLTIAPGDDYAMLREVLTRRLVRLEKEDPDRNGPDWPDLLLIDGGAGQLATACAVIQEIGIPYLPVVAIAKGADRNAGREQFFIPGREPFRLPPHDAVLHYLQRLRDEAHRFAIGTHRKRRSLTFTQSELDAIEGIGPTRKRALLHHFGSAREVANATLAEMEKVPGINKKTARLVYDFFHPTP